jgi:Aspartyl/Asparaginyl beta-hydroxylase
MALLPTTYPDHRRRKYQKKLSSWWQGKAGTFLLFAVCFLGYAGWRRGSRIVDSLPSINGANNRGASRRDLKEQIKNNVALTALESGALGAPAPGLTTFPAQDDARRILVATHSKLAWYNYEVEHFTIIHEGEGIYYGGFSGDQIDPAGVPETVWAISRPHNWRPTTSKEWLLEINIVTGKVQRRESIPSRFTHDTVRYGNRVYAADCGEGHILELEFPSMKVLRRMELFTLKEHVNTLSPTENGTLWAMLHNLGPSILAEIDLETGREIRRLPNIGDKSHGAVQWRGSIISLNSDNAALMKVDTATGRTEQLWQDDRAKRYLKGLCVVDDVAFFGIAEAQERQSRDSGELNCEIGAYDLIEGVLLWRRQLQTEGLLNVVSAPHLQVESTSHAVWMSDPKQSYRATSSYAKHLATAKGSTLGNEHLEQLYNHPSNDDNDVDDESNASAASAGSLKKLTLLDLEPLETYDPLNNYPPLLGGRWASGYPRFDNSAKDKAHGLSSGAQLPLFRWNQTKLRDYLLGLPLSDWSEEAARKSNAWLAGREGNLNQFKPGTHAIHLIFSDQQGDNVYQFPWYKERFAFFLEPLIHKLLGVDVANIIRMQFALMPGNTHIKRHVDKGGYSATGHRIHLVVASSPKVDFHVCERDTCVPIHVDEGLVFELNNRLEHYVNNEGSMPRIHLVIDVAESARKRIILRTGQVCQYINGRIEC